jgi:hypothetical protein
MKAPFKALEENKHSHSQNHKTEIHCVDKIKVLEFKSSGM